MPVSLLRSIINTFDSCWNQERNERNNMFLEEYNTYKKSVLNFYIRRRKMASIFESKFNRLVEDAFVLPHSSLNNISHMYEREKQYMNTALPLKVILIQKKLRKLFFSDLISYYYEFLFSINTEIYKEIDGNLVFRKEYYLSFLAHLVKNTPFAAQNNINFAFIKPMVEQDYPFEYFLNILEDLIMTRTGNSKEVIRKCVYLERSFYFDVMNEKKISEFYKIIHMCLKLADPGVTLDEDYIYTKTSNNISYYRVPFALDVTKGVLSVFFAYNRSLFKINTVSSFNQINNFFSGMHVDFGLKEFELYEICCLKKQTNLLIVSCEKHRRIFNAVRRVYLKIIEYEVWSESSLFFEVCIRRMKRSWFGV
ncbi:hypothetical protein CDIK_0686 [Cucumispora dikerogammari]|nr:hypothetical protein CDIK_0686 [Cucumispora dikerogammari]